jgi:outer membrane protein TolC
MNRIDSRRERSSALYSAIRQLRIVVAFVFAVASAAVGQERQLSLQEAIDLAIHQNHTLRAAGYAVASEQQKQRIAKSDFFPNITNESSLLHITDLQRLDVPAGAFGVIPGGAAIPSSNVFLTQGTQTLETSGTMIAQPLTQLIKIHQANMIAAADLKASEAALAKTSTDVVFRVHELYYRVLATQMQRQAAELQIASGNENLNESTEQVKNGSLLQVNLVESRASLLEAKQTLLTYDSQLSDLKVELNDLLGLPLDTKLALDPDVDVSVDVPLREETVRTALNNNPEIKEALQQLSKAQAAHSAAKAEYIPDVTAFARYSYQNGVPFVDRNFGTFGIHLSYDLFDGGKRRALVRERRDEISEAKENLQRIKDEVEVRIAIVYNRLETTRAMVEVEKEYLAARDENARLAEDQFQQGISLASQRDASRAQAMKARAGLLDASLAYLLARDELTRTLGGEIPR